MPRLFFGPSTGIQYEYDELYVPIWKVTIYYITYTIEGNIQSTVHHRDGKPVRADKATKLILELIGEN